MLVQVIYKNWKIIIIIQEFNFFKNMYEQHGGIIYVFNYDCLPGVITDIKKKHGLTNDYFRYYGFAKPKQLKRSRNGNR